MILLCFFFSFTTQAQNKNRAAIRDVLRVQTEAWNRADIEGFMQTYWQSDSLLFIGKKGITRGWQATLDNYKKNYPNKTAMGTLSFNIIEVRKLSRRYYFVVGKWMLQRSGDAPSGHFSILLRRIKKSWKIVADHSS